jgi:hypothetical protein
MSGVGSVIRAGNKLDIRLIFGSGIFDRALASY